MISLEKAREILSDYVNKTLMLQQKVESVPLWEAGGRVLAVDVASSEDVPAFHRSHVDGFAVFSSDVVAAAEDNPVVLRIIDTVAAGSDKGTSLLPGTAIKIFTGAPLPQGADCIIKREETEEIAETEGGAKETGGAKGAGASLEGKEGAEGGSTVGSAVIIKRSVQRGENISRRGEDFLAGVTLYPRGSVISFTQTEILATLGIDPVDVYVKPRIGIFSTGNELVAPREPLTHGKLRASNLYALAELIRLAGGVPVNLGIAKDRLADVLHVYEQAEQLKLPIVISTGGTASGDLDYMKEAMEQTGSVRMFNKIAIRPGAPFVASMKKDQLLVGLSGNPGGAIVAFLLLLLPIISRLEGCVRGLLPDRGNLTTSIVRQGGLRGFFWGRYEEEESENRRYVTPFGNQYCGALETHKTSNCLVDIPAGEVDLPVGSDIAIWRLPVPPLARADNY